jgi:hypothetical protein
VPLKPIPAVMSTTTLPAPPSLVEAPPVATAAARLVVRMLGGEELELATFDGREGAIEAAKELVASFSAAEDSGDWPELDGRFLRPASVASIDVLVV